MAIAEAVQFLEDALENATPEAVVVAAREPLGVRHSVVAYQSGSEEFRSGRVETVACVINVKQSRPDQPLPPFLLVRQHAQSFVSAIKGTKPGDMLIYWPQGIQTDFQETDDDITAVVSVPLCDRYPVN